MLVGGAEPKMRRPRPNEWTKAKVEAFMTALAETCNVTLAAQAAGMSLTGAYAKRKKDAAFRAGWAEAIAGAYQRLELALLDRALNGTEKVVTRRDGSQERRVGRTGLWRGRAAPGPVGTVAGTGHFAAGVGFAQLLRSGPGISGRPGACIRRKHFLGSGEYRIAGSP